jgi:uncharacterized OB-fold protein
MMPGRPLPEPAVAASDPWWCGLRERRLMLQLCPTCGALRYPAAPVCPECRTTGGVWTEVPAEGSLFSFVTYHRDLSGSFADDIPYTIALVELEPMIGILAQVEGRADSLRIGDRMRAQFEEVSPMVTLLRWAPMSTEAGRSDA